VNGTEHPFDIALLSCRMDKENILGRKLIGLPYGWIILCGKGDVTASITYMYR